MKKMFLLAACLMIGAAAFSQTQFGWFREFQVGNSGKFNGSKVISVGGDTASTASQKMLGSLYALNKLINDKIASFNALLQQNALTILQTSVVYNLAEISAHSSLSFTATVAGAAVGNMALVSLGDGPGEYIAKARVSAVNEVTVSVSNLSGTALDHGVITYHIIVLK